jgi:uncharacterized protein YlxP (DUF503 family)
MIVKTLIIKIRIPWSHSLKEKRREVKSISAKVRNKFNVSIAEVEEQDIHQIIVFGISFVTTDNSQADSIASNVIDYIEEITDGEVIEVRS